MTGPLAALLLQSTPLQSTPQSNFWDLISTGSPLANIVLVILILFSVYSWTIIFAKMSAFGSARKSDSRFLRAFRKANGLEAVMVASEQFRPSPLVSVFDFGYQEVSRQVKARGALGNRDAISRCLQIGTNQQLSRLERNLSWLATTASVSPFIGLFGTVLGIIRAFQNLTGAGSSSLASVGPGIAEALIATAAGLFAAIPAAMAYNHFGHVLKELGGQMDDFSLEFLNLIERSLESSRMAINVGGLGGGRRTRGIPAMAEINVTPFVDVALVLLIIFMITAHAMDSGIEIDVPKTKTVASQTKDLPIVSITKAGEVYLGKNHVNLNNLVDEIHTRYPGQKAVYIKADRQTTMDIGVNVMSVLGNAKFGINVVTELDEGKH